MIFSSELLQRMSRGVEGGVAFEMILALSYYDGPEHGLALHASGAGVRFSSLGDSRSRLFRAFELIPIEGNWRPQIEMLHTLEGTHLMRKVLLPSKESEALTELEMRINRAPGFGQFVCVGSPNLERISVAAVTPEQLESLRKLDCSPAGFDLAHRLVKKSRSTRN